MVSKRSGKSPRQFLEGAGLVLGGQRRRKETQTPGLVQGTAASSRAHSRKAAGMAQKAPIGKNGETGRPLMTRARRSRQEATRPEQQQQQQQPQPQPSRRSRQRYQHQHQHQHQQQAHAQYYHQPQQVQPVPRHGGVMEDLEQRLHAVHLGPAQPEFLPPQQYEAPLLQDAYLHQQQQQQHQQHQLPPEHHSQFEVHSQFEARQNSPQHQHQQYQQQQHQQQFFYEPRQHELYYSESGNPNPVQHLQPVSQNLYQQHQQQQELLVQQQHQLGVRPAVEHAAGPALWSLAPGHVEEQGLLHVNRVEEYYHQHHHHHHQQQQQQQYHQQHPQQDLEQQQQQQQYHQQHQHQHQQLLLQHEEALLARRREAEQEERNRRGDHAEEVFPRRASPRSLPQESPLRAEDDDYGRAFYETSSRCPEGVPQLWQWQHLQRHPQLQHFHPQLREGAQQQQEGGGAGERPAQLREQFVFPLQHLEQTPERRAYQPRRQQQQQQQQQKVHYRIHEQNQEQEHGQPAAHLECEQGPRSQNLQGAAAVTQSLRQKNPGQNLVRNQPHSAATVEAKEARNSGEALHAHPHHDLGVPQQYVRKQGGRAEEEEGKLEEEEEEEEEEAEPETEAETALETAAAAAESKSTCARGPARKAAHKTPGPGRGEEGRARRQQTRNLAQDWQQQQQQQQQQRRTYSRTASNGSTGSEASNRSGRMIAELMRRADSPRPKSVVFAESVKTYDASASLHAVNLILAVFTGQVTTSEQLLNCVPERDLRADLVVKLQRVSEALSHASAEINVNGVILTHASKKYVDRMIRDFQASINSAAPKTSAAPAAAVKPIAQPCKVAAATC